MASERTDEYAHLTGPLAIFAGLTGADPRRQELREVLVQGYLPVAKNIARRFARRNEPMEDLQQVATVGLINALDRFDPVRGVHFLAFAVPTITGEVRRHFRDRSWAMHVPRRLKDLKVALGRTQSAMSQELGRAPTARELATELGVPFDDVVEALAAERTYSTSELDESFSNGAAAAVTEAGFALVEDRETVGPLLRTLPERERRIIILRFYRNMTQTEIAREIGVSQMHVSRLLARTLIQLREGMSPDRKSA